MASDYIKDLIDCYVSGGNVRNIAAAFNVTPQTVYNILARNNIQKRSVAQQTKKDKFLEACREGAIASVTAEQLGISASTATRTIRHERSKTNLPLKKGRPEKSRSRIYSAAGSSPLLDAEYAHLSMTPFPYPTIAEDELRQELEKLKNYNKSYLKDKEICPQSTIGVRICAPFFPNRFKARTKSKFSAFDAWQDKNTLQKAIKFQIDHGDPTTPKRVLRAITLMCRTPSIFRPAVAKFIYENFCPKGGVVWDPCSGYGGRLLGAFAANVQYIGTDVDLATIEGNKELARVIGYHPVLNMCPAEEFCPPPLDLVFTSPPYFNREKYSQDSNQSYKKYKDLDSWLTYFLRPLIEKSFNALKYDAYLIINIADVKEKRGAIIPLVEHTTNIARTLGFAHKDTLLMPLRAINRKAPKESVLVFQKIKSEF